MDLGLADTPVIVAGSSRGIGNAVARGFLAEGARVAITGRDPEALERAAAALSEAHGADRVLPLPGDLGDGDRAEAVVAAVRERWGEPACAVLNVGSGTAKSGWQLGPAEWDAAFRANLWTSVRVAEAVLPAMLDAGRGSVVFIASIVGVEHVNAPLPYSAAKAALMSYVKGLARTVGPRSVRVNAVVPGNVLFAGGSWEAKVAADPERWRGYVETEVPLQRFGRPEEIADAALFLASERAAFVTGACLVVDGGQTRSLAW